MAIGFSFAKPYINKRVKMFPVNSVYLSIVNTNPSVVLGYGTWVSFGTGKVLVGVDATDPDFNIPEKTGGNKTNTPSAHAGTAVADHVFTQPSGHSNHVFTQAANHVFTQPSGHSNHVFTQAANHVFTQPAGHSNHVFTQPSAHAVHLHDVGTLATPSHTSVSSKQGSSSGNVITTGTHSFTGSTANNSSTQSHSGGGVDAHSAHAGGGVDAHSGSGVDAHSAHAGGAVDSHSGSGVDAHSAHSGGAVDSHNVTQPNDHAALSVVQPYITVFMFKRTA